MRKIKIMQFIIKHNTNDVRTYIIPELKDIFQNNSSRVDSLFNIIRKYSISNKPIKITAYVDISNDEVHIQTKSNFKLKTDEDPDFTEHCNEALNLLFTRMLQEGMNRVM